uniref:Uncharacterized protein n=1 Tax=Phaeodactylum tricornutum TaxID=2850 RepID=A0A8J9SXM9_PHATR
MGKPVASRSRAPTERSPPPKERKSCCRICCLSVILLILLLGVGGILVWLFFPEEAKSQLNNVVNTTGNVPKVPSVTIPGTGGGSAPEPTYQFMQCTDPSVCCNGLSTLCDATVDSVMYAALHNAMATSEDGFFLGPNHDYKLEDALKWGYRGINLDIGNCNGELQFIHGRCLLGSRNVVEVLTNINTFLTENPSEVVILPLQIDNSVGAGTIDLFDIYSIMQSVPGFTDRMYVHPEVTTEWPTLGELVETDKRILFFHYGGPSCWDNSSPCPPGFHDWFYYGAETRFSFSDVDAIRDTTSSCEITRGENSRRRFFSVNNFVTLPSSNAAGVLNRLNFVQQHVQQCSALNDGLDVNLVFVDFWHKGNLPEAVQLHNSALARRLIQDNGTRKLLRSPRQTYSKRDI